MIRGCVRKCGLTGSLAGLLILLQPQAFLGASRGPTPPCEGAVFPPYAAVEAPLNVRVWLGESPAGKWTPPACTGWEDGNYTILVAGAGRFHHQGDVDELLVRVGALSNLPTIRYWSVSRGRWHRLFPQAYALAGPDRAIRRADFSNGEMRPGKKLYFWQKESSSAGSGVYQLRVLARGPEQLAFDVQNVTPVQIGFVTLFAAGEYTFLYFLEKESSRVWRYYSLFRAGTGPSLLANLHRKSYVNRAVAVYRYLAGIPTDREPPTAP